MNVCKMSIGGYFFSGGGGGVLWRDKMKRNMKLPSLTTTHIRWSNDQVCATVEDYHEKRSEWLHTMYVCPSIYFSLVSKMCLDLIRIWNFFKKKVLLRMWFESYWFASDKFGKIVYYMYMAPILFLLRARQMFLPNYVCMCLNGMPNRNDCIRQ